VITAAVLLLVACISTVIAREWRRRTQPLRVLNYSMLVHKYRGGQPYGYPFRLAGPRVFEADYRIKLIVSSPQPGHLYVLNEESAGNGAGAFNVLSPVLEEPAWKEPNQTTVIPMKFDTVKGTEILWIVWSERPVPELEAVRQWANPKDLGRVGDSAQSQRLRDFLVRGHASPPGKAEDAEQRITIVKRRAAILVDRMALDHE
jgi:hypothetical protein